MLNKSIIILVIGFAHLFGQQGKDSTKLVVSGKTVVFFAPSQKEYNSLAKDTNSGVDEILSDFYYYKKSLNVFLKENNVNTELTSALSIVVKLSNGKTNKYRRKDFDHIVGMILTDGMHKPKVILGVYTDVDLIPDLKKFFKLK
jgi:hypothetical protein